MLNVQRRSFRPVRPPFDRVLVTGGAGFIGSRVVKLLSDLGCEVIVVDNLYVCLPLPPAGNGIAPVQADIRDRAAMKDIFARHQPDAVIHLAAVHHIPTCEKDPDLAFDVNIMGTQSLLDAAYACGTRHVVMASSGAVYEWADGVLNETKSGTSATDVYSITKLTNEYQIGGWADRTESRAHIARLFNTIGSGDPNGHLIPDILAQIKSSTDKATIGLGNTKPKRDYIYVDDAASGFVAILSQIKTGQPREIFNLCTGQESSVADLVNLIGEIVGTKVVIELDASRLRKIDRMQQLGDPAKLQDRTGWRHAWSLKDALCEIIDQLNKSH